MNLLKTTLAALCLTLGLRAAGQEAWDQTFALNKRPTDYGAGWTYEQWGAGAGNTFYRGWLKIYTNRGSHNNAAGAVFRITSETGIWDASQAASVEFRVCVITPGRERMGAAAVVGDGRNIYAFRLGNCGMTTYRIDLEGGVAKLYADFGKHPVETVRGEPMPANAADANFFYFGDAGSGMEGCSTWEYVRWTKGRLAGREESPGFGYSRDLNYTWFPDDPRQWSGYGDAVVIDDLSLCRPASNLAPDRREKGKWRILEYETTERKGKALSVFGRTEARPVTIDLGQKGLYAIYVGLINTSAFHEAERSAVRVKLSSEESYKILFNNVVWLDYRRNSIQETFLTVAELGKKDRIEFGQYPATPASIAYVKLVPVTKTEYAAFAADARSTEFRKNIGAVDGHAVFLYNRARTEEDIKAHLRHMEHGDYGKWWYQTLGADLANYPTEVGTITSSGTEDLPRWYDEEYIASTTGLIENGVNSLRTVRDAAREQDVEFHVMLRPQGWYGAIPFEETFNSRFFIEHPEWRCADEYGTPTLYMSYAVPEVKEHLKEMIREIIATCDPDGMGFIFNRGAPFMLWEEPFADLFRRKYGEELSKAETHDQRIRELRGEIMTAFIADVRSMLDELGKAAGKRYALNVSVLSRAENYEHGLEVEKWIGQGLVDDIAVSQGDVAHYASMSERVYPFLTTWDGLSQPGEYARRITGFYDQGAAGMMIWDADSAPFDKGPEPHLSSMVNYTGHRSLMEHWGRTFSPRPNIIPLLRLHDIEYSGWQPNSGF